ncbi:WYL domain-containing protein [Novosphingobium sp.]|uniref:WYL domain-containing protein n=1 Tax=Novosphingobium sp. TaxID=1874826 RepID=UPI00286C6A41|nr:WYL domain-containing protein [Novosphingobium sp.]
MTLGFAVLCIAGMALLAFFVIARNAGREAKSKPPATSSEEFEDIDTEKFAALMAAPISEKSIQQSLHSGMRETSRGVWKTKDEIKEEERYWRIWRSTLSMVPIHVNGMTLYVDHGGQTLHMQIEAILANEGNWYLDGYCREISDRRTFALDRIEALTTDDGVHFAGVREWLINRVKIAPAVADDLGLIIPPIDARR